MPRISQKPQQLENYLIKGENAHLYMKGAFLLALFAFAYAAVLFASSYARQTTPVQNLPSFSVTGEGKIIAIPDVAQFTFKVVTEGGLNLVDLQTENSRKANLALSYLKSNSIDTKDIQTQGYNIFPRYEYGNCPSSQPVCPPPTIAGYSITQTVEVKVRDLSKAGDIIANVVNNGANSVSQLNFAIDDPAGFQEQASAKAMAQARDRAQKMADAGGFRLGRLLNVYESGNTPIFYDTTGLGGMPAEKSSPTPPVIEPGSQKITSSVTLQFEIAQ